MELFIGVVSTIWEELDNYTVPIVNVSVKSFLLIVLILDLVVTLLNFFLGKSLDTFSKGGSTFGSESYVSTYHKGGRIKYEKVGK